MASTVSLRMRVKQKPGWREGDGRGKGRTEDGDRGQWSRRQRRREQGDRGWSPLLFWEEFWPQIHRQQQTKPGPGKARVSGLDSGVQPCTRTLPGFSFLSHPAQRAHLSLTAKTARLS